MKCTKLIRNIKKQGWVLARIRGSHYHFKHPTIEGLITIPFHSSKDVSPGVLHSIKKLIVIHS